MCLNSRRALGARPVRTLDALVELAGGERAQLSGLVAWIGVTMRPRPQRRTLNRRQQPPAPVRASRA